MKEIICSQQSVLLVLFSIILSFLSGKSFSLENGLARKVINLCEVYDPETNTWEEGQPMKSARCGFAAVAIWSDWAYSSRASTWRQPLKCDHCGFATVAIWNISTYGSKASTCTETASEVWSLWICYCGDLKHVHVWLQSRHMHRDSLWSVITVDLLLWRSETYPHLAPKLAHA